MANYIKLLNTCYLCPSDQLMSCVFVWNNAVGQLAVSDQISDNNRDLDATVSRYHS